MTESNPIKTVSRISEAPDILRAADISEQSEIAEGNGNYPTPEWQQFGDHAWRASDLSEHLHQAMIDIGDGIELCVEAGGNPNNPPLLMIMGLGSQMIFWPN